LRSENFKERENNGKFEVSNNIKTYPTEAGCVYLEEDCNMF